MDDSTALLLLLLILLASHALVSLFNAALLNAHRATLRQDADGGDITAERILELSEGRLQLSMTVRLTHIITRFAIATVLVLLVMTGFANGDSSALLGSTILLVLVGASLTLILCDLIPEVIGASYANGIARLAVGPTRLLILILSPVTMLLLFISQLISSILGSGQLVNRVTEEEIMTLVNASHTGGAIDEEEKDMIYSVLHLDESSARELMTPRMDIVALDVTDTMQNALSAFVESGFSRIPVYEDSIDNVIGLLYAKDILSLLNDKDTLDNKAIRDLIRPSYFVPETKRADALLKELQECNVHLAIVVDEYGGTSGLVTIENLIEEIVGDIRDEYDTDEEEDYVEVGDGVYLIEASIDLDDINELLDCAIETEDADTLGGYIFLILGRVPEANEVIETDTLSMTIQSIDGRRIRKVRVEKKTPTKNPITEFQSPKLKDEAS